MKTILGTLVAVFSVITLATGCSTQEQSSAETGILGDGEFSTDPIDVLPYSRGRFIKKVSKDPNGLGYFGLGYFGLGYYASNWNRLNSLAVDNGQQSSQPTVEAVKTFKYQPLTRPLFIYVNAETVQNKPELQDFIQFYLEDVRKWVSFVGYVPLEKEAYKLVSERFQQKIIGTVYGGELQSEVGVKEILQRESVF